MTRRRRRGVVITAYPQKQIEDRRGNLVFGPDLDSPQTARAAVIPQRSSRAEVPGQRAIEVVRLLVDPSVRGVSLWSRVSFDGRDWDVMTPPFLRKSGTRHTRHWALDARAREHG